MATLLLQQIIKPTIMKKIGIFYGSTTGTTEAIARAIASKLDVGSNDVHDAAKLTAELAGQYDMLILGSSTWGDGELQDDWHDAVKVLKGMNLAGKCIALFGCGDSASYSDTFCDAMGILHEELQGTGCQFCGAVDADGYTFDSSKAVADGQFVGLALDEANESDLTDGRINAWIKTLCNQN